MSAQTKPMNADRIREDRQRAETWLLLHLRIKTGAQVPLSDTPPGARLRRIGAVIVDKGLADQPIGRFNGRSEDHRQFCKRALGLDIP